MSQSGNVRTNEIYATLGNRCLITNICEQVSQKASELISDLSFRFWKRNALPESAPCRQQARYTTGQGQLDKLSSPKVTGSLRRARTGNPNDMPLRRLRDVQNRRMVVRNCKIANICHISYCGGYASHLVFYRTLVFALHNLQRIIVRNKVPVQCHVRLMLIADAGTPN